MKKTLTLRKNNEFQYIFKKGSWYNSKNISMYVIKNEKDVNMLGIAVGKKVAKSVKRNRIKRLIREAYRLNENNIKTGYSIIIVWKTKSEVINATFKGIENDLLECFKKAGITL